MWVVDFNWCKTGKGVTLSHSLLLLFLARGRATAWFSCDTPLLLGGANPTHATFATVSLRGHFPLQAIVATSDLLRPGRTGTPFVFLLCGVVVDSTLTIFELGDRQWLRPLPFSGYYGTHLSYAESEVLRLLFWSSEWVFAIVVSSVGALECQSRSFTLLSFPADFSRLICRSRGLNNELPWVSG